MYLDTAIGIGVGIGIGSPRHNGSGPAQPPFTSNLKALNTSVWNAAAHGVIAGTGRATECYVGDSTFLGVGSPSGADLQANCRAGGMPAQLVTLRNANGLPSNFNISLGTQFGPTQTALSDTRLFPGAGWSLTGVASGGGAAIKATAISSPSLWTMANCTRLKFLYYGLSSTGVFEVLIDGVSVQTVTTSTAPNKVWHATPTLTLTPGAHTIAVNWVSGGEVDISGPICWDPETPAVDVYNLGIGGSTSTTWAVNDTYFPLVMAQFVQANLYHVNLGINDLIAANTSNVVFNANMRTIVTALLATGGNVILYAPTPCNNVQFIAGIGAYIAILQQISIDFNIGFVNLFAWLGGVYTASNYYAGNNPVHPNFATYGNEAALVDTVTRFFL